MAADEDNNRFESNKKWIEWKSLSDGETLLYSQKNYNKPRDEEALKKKIKYKIKQSDDRAQKRQGDAGPRKTSRVKYEHGIERVKNNKKWKEWTHLEITGSTTYKGRTFKKNVPDNAEKLMNRIIKSTEYNQSYSRGKKEVAAAAEAMVDIRKGGGKTNDGGIATSKDDKDDHDDDDDCKPAAKPTASVDDRGKETGVYLNDVVIEEGCEDAVVDGGRDDDNFDVDGNDLGQSKGETKLTDCAKDDPVSNVGTSNGSVGNMDEIGEETTLTDGPNDPVSNADANNSSVENMNEIGEETTLTGGPNDPVSDADVNNGSVENMNEIGEETMLTDGPNDTVSDADVNNGSVENMNEIGEETTLTDGPNDPVSDVGANNGTVKNMEEIGIIFEFDGVEKKIPLKEIGSYVKFNKECLHKGYKTGKKTTFLSAQIFSAPIGSRRLVQSNVAKFEEGLLNKDDISRLENISEKIQQGWEEKYKSNNYKAPKKFQSRKVNQDKTRKIDQRYFKDPDLDEVKNLIEMFETIYQDTIRVVEVWFLKKRTKKDGFERFHYDFGSVRGGLNDVSSTIVVNLGVFHEEDEEEDKELEEESEDEESDDESVEEGVLFAAAAAAAESEVSEIAAAETEAAAAETVAAAAWEAAAAATRGGREGLRPQWGGGVRSVSVAPSKWTGPRGVRLPLRRAKPGTNRRFQRNRIIKVRVSLQQAEFEQTLEAMLMLEK